MKKLILKIFKVTGISLGSILALMFVLPILFPGFVTEKIKGWANNAITGELNFSKARLSFFNHFPSLTLTLYDFSLKGSEPYKNDTLVGANEVSLGINLASLLSKSIKVDEIYLTKGNINVLVNEKGEANYNVYKAAPAQKTKSNDTGSVSLRIAKIQIDHTNIHYNDKSLPMVVTAMDLNYLGQGDLDKAIFDLKSELNIGEFDFTYGGENYLHTKKLYADLITKVNTNSLSFIFERNDMRINQLPINFKGKLDFLQEGYDMDFRISSGATNLHDVFTALPPQYVKWMEKTDLRGTTEFNVTLSGRYNDSTMPSLSFDMKIRDGYVAYDKAPVPAENLYLDFKAALPHFNTDSMFVNIDSVHFTQGKGTFNSVLRLQNINDPHIVTARIHSDLDMDPWMKAFGIPGFEVKGNMKLDFDAQGHFNKEVVHSGLRNKKADTVITCIPTFNLKAQMTNGYVKYAKMPMGVSNISFNLNAQAPDTILGHAHFSLDNLNATALDNYIRGYFHLLSMKDYEMDGNLQALINLADIAKIYPMDSLSVAGHLNLNAMVKGKYAPEKKVYPVANAQLVVNDGQLKTAYYPNPIEQIKIDATIINNGGDAKSMNVNLKPISFVFEGQPFMIKADVQNLDNLRYNVASQGTLDIGKIYKVFSQDGLDVKGLIRTDLNLKGLQSDATAGRYAKLRNSGTLQMEDITVHYDNLPLPLIVKDGKFRFKQDKVWLEQFKGNYGSSNFTLNGYLSNVINYALKDDAKLKGNFDLRSKELVVDEFTVNGDAKPAKSNMQAPPKTASGVVIVPSNLNVVFNAGVDKVKYNGLDIRDFKGQMRVENSKIILNQTGFNLVGAPVVMNASYGAINATKAFFTYSIDAKNFDVHRAYKEIKLFHDMATSAGKVNGIVSLQYQLSGKLDANMSPIYPSLKGNGVLSIGKIKVNGLKIFGAVGKATLRDSISNPELSNVNIRSSIANNIITIERTKMKVLGFRPRFEGQVSFNGQMALKARLGLPPFGIIGIPFTVTGTSENPKVKLGRGKNADKLEETRDDADDEDVKEAALDSTSRMMVPQASFEQQKKGN